MSNPHGSWQQPQRSTPIPGSSEPISAPAGFDAPPPTPAQFLGGAAPAPPQQPTWGAGMPGQMPGQMPTVVRRRRGGGGLVLVMVILVILGAIGGVTFWVLRAAKDTVNDAVVEFNSPEAQQLDDKDREALGLTGGELNTYDGEGMAKLAAAFDAASPGDPSQFTELLFYSNYAFATVQDPTTPGRLDEYPWRDAVVGTPSPQPNDDTAPSQVFTAADVNWAAVATLMPDIVRIAGVEDGEITHVIVSRDAFTDGSPVTVRIYVSGPRSSAYVQVAADGTVVATF